MGLQHVTEEEGHKTREYLQYIPNNSKNKTFSQLKIQFCIMKM